MPREPGTYVFVYGTLRRGGSNDIGRRHPEAQYVADAEIAATLYDLGAYPGAVLHGATGGVSQKAKGEIYRITSQIESALDVLEEIAEDGSGEYVRRHVDVEVGETTFLCLVYEIHPSRIAGRNAIAGGDWFLRG